MEITLGEKLELLRKRKGLSQDRLGEMLGLSAYTIGKIESGETSPRVEQLQGIANVLGADLTVAVTVVAPETA